MNYYDHAVMMTYRLGPWAEPGGNSHPEFRCPPRSNPLSALTRWIGRALQTLRDTRIKLVRVERQPHLGTDDCKSITKA